MSTQASESKSGTALETEPVVLGRSLFLLPEEVVVEDIGDRIEDPAESKDLQELADSIKTGGQEQPGRVYERLGPEGVEYVLYIGRRRRTAIAMINAQAPAGEPAMKLWCVLGSPDQDSFHAALEENLRRKNYSAVELANIIKKVRERYGWKGTKEVAEYLGVSRAQISTHDKILTSGLDREVLERAHRERWPAELVFTLVNVKPEKSKEVAGKATAKAEAEASAKGKGKGEARVQTKHVREAVKETPDALKEGKTLKPKMKDVTELFDSLDGPAYSGWPAVSEFCRYFVDKYATGKGTESTLIAKFDAMLGVSKDEKKEAVAKAKEKEEAEAARAKAKEAKAKADAEKAKAAAAAAKAPAKAK